MNADKLKALVKLMDLMKTRTSKKTKAALEKSKKPSLSDTSKNLSEDLPIFSDEPKNSKEKMPTISYKSKEPSESIYKEGAEMSGMAGYLPEMNDDVNMKLQRQKIKEQKPYDRIEKKEK
jgi:hypothetical protein